LDIDLSVLLSAVILSAEFHSQHNPHCRACPHMGLFYQQFTVMIFFHDALGQAQAQAPAALFGAEARPEDVFAIGRFDAAAIVLHVDEDLP
jgi:hypothetical protein